ncbi:MAG: DVUA0089 family protein [Nostoc indistinguendum CM1-VF10]|jgi:hypothetical protein|nr:DVUA0089 family protein [Nostoc indistinguendum CM1-VF10]
MRISNFVIGFCLVVSTVFGAKSAHGVAIGGSLPSPGGNTSLNFTVPKLFSTDSDVGIRIRTLSYGGGISFDSPTVPGGSFKKQQVSRGGFDPILAIFDSSGNQVAIVDDASILGNRPDPITGLTFDAGFDIRLKPGDYQLRVTQYDNFEGTGLSGIKGFTDVSGSARENTWFVQLHTIDDFLKNTVKITDENGNVAKSKLSNAIYANFQPELAVIQGFNNLNSLASFGGFDHFNWYQEITSIDSGLATNICRGIGVDPLPGGNCSFTIADQFKWYWDETPVFGRGDFFVQERTKATELEYVDAPNLLISETSAEFVTYLAGVQQGDEGIIFSNKGGNFNNLAFKWRFTQKANFAGQGLDRLCSLLGKTCASANDITNIAFLQNIDPNLAGEGEIEFLGFLQPEDWTEERINRLQSVGLQVVGLENSRLSIEPPVSTSVPEPSTLLGYFTLIGLGYKFRRKKTQSKS